jgi:hypothetical protein
MSGPAKLLASLQEFSYPPRSCNIIFSTQPLSTIADQLRFLLVGQVQSDRLGGTGLSPVLTEMKDTNLSS